MTLCLSAALHTGSQSARVIVLVIVDRITRQRVSSVVGRRAGEQKVLMRYLHDIEGIKFGSDQTMRLLPPATMSPQTKPARTQRLSTRPRSAIPGSLNM